MALVPPSSSGGVTVASIGALYTAAGQVVIGTGSGTAAVALAPGFEYGYTQITAPVTVTSSTEGTPTTVIAAAPITFDGAAVMVEFFAPFASAAAATGAQLLINLFEGATNLGRITSIQNELIGGTTQIGLQGRLRFTPTVGAHTYTITGWQGGGNATVGAGAGGTAAYSPSFVRFTKV